MLFKLIGYNQRFLKSSGTGFASQGILRPDRKFPRQNRLSFYHDIESMGLKNRTLNDIE
jgi:hypothetical protein